MVGCAIGACRNWFKKAGSVSYHKFPGAPDIRHKWTICCNRTDKFNAVNARICSRHFTDDDYEVNKMNEALGIPYKKYLKRTAVPTLNLDTNIHWRKIAPKSNAQFQQTLHTDVNILSNSEQRSVAARTYNTRKSKRKSVRSSLQCSPVAPLHNISQKTYDDKETNTELDLSSIEKSYEGKSKYADKGTITDLGMSKFEKLIIEKNRLLFIQEQKMKSLQKELLLAKRNVESLNNLHRKCSAHKEMSSKNLNSAVEKRLHSMLKSWLSPQQIAFLLKKHHGGSKAVRVKWTAEDINFALDLKSVSAKAYKLLRSRGMPLPGRATLQRWNANNNQATSAVDSIDI